MAIPAPATRRRRGLNGQAISRARAWRPSGGGDRPQYPRLSPQAEPGGAADPRQESGPRPERAHLLAKAHRRRGQEDPAIGHRQCREQSRPGRGRSGGCGSQRRQEPGDEALSCARPWQCRRHREVLQPDHHRGRRKARREEGRGQGARLQGQACGQEDFGQGAREKTCGQKGQEGSCLMGQKVNPTGLRLGINRTWDSRWYAGKKEYGKLLQEDIKIREYLSDKLKAAGVSRIIIERPHKKCRVTIHSARPGVVIGKKGADIEKLKSDVQKYTTDEVHLNIVEIRKPEIDAKLVAENIAQQLERRVAFRRVMKRAVQSAQRLGA